MTEFVYDYSQAFKRNIGLVSEEQQRCLQNATVGIAGLGGAGGVQSLALARLGVGCFKLADLDNFELDNFNRQAGASVHSLGKSKTSVIEQQILGINPTCKIQLFNEGINKDSVESFVDDCSIVIDALDLRCIRERFLLYRAARAAGKWVLAGAPVGFGIGLLLFDPGGMTFEQYFDIAEDMPEAKIILSIGFGFSPAPLGLPYYTNLSAIRVAEAVFPCIGPACLLLAGVAATEVYNFLVTQALQPKRAIRRPKPVPHVLQYDALVLKSKRTYYPLGMRNPFMKLLKMLVFSRLKLAPTSRRKNILSEESTSCGS